MAEAFEAWCDRGVAWVRWVALRRGWFVSRVTVARSGSVYVHLFHDGGAAATVRLADHWQRRRAGVFYVLWRDVHGGGGLGEFLAGRQGG